LPTNTHPIKEHYVHFPKQESAGTLKKRVTLTHHTTSLFPMKVPAEIRHLLDQTMRMELDVSSSVRLGFILGKGM